jgi:hypothetical protein
MSRYHVDKVLFEVTGDPDCRQRFLEDSASYLDGRELEPGERQALIDRDYRALYISGAQPLMLWQFTVSVLASPDKPARQLMQEYLAAIAPFGRPDYST